MKEILLFALLTLIYALPAQSQNFSIAGSVETETQELIYMGEVMVRTKGDSLLIRGVITDERGEFLIKNIPNGVYILQVHFLGYTTYTTEVIIENKDVEIGKIALSENSQQLSEVILEGRKPLLEKKINKTVLNIENSIYQKGEDGYRLFNVIPEVQADNVGNLTFRGQERVTVYIDNRKIEMGGSQLMNYLKSIPSESIKNIEINAVPSSEFDAANTGAIINIVLKKEYTYGLNGTLFTNFEQHRYFQGSGGAFLSYRKGNIKIQGNYTYSKGRGFFDNEETQTFKTMPLAFHQDEDYKENINAHNAKIGFDYELTENQIIGSNYEINFWDAQTNGLSENTTRNSTTFQIDSLVITSNKKPLTLKNQLFNLFYRNRLDSIGSQLDAGYNYVSYDNRVKSFIRSNFLDENGTQISPEQPININNPLKIHINTLNVDIFKVLKNKYSLKVGSKFSNSKTDNDIQYFDGENLELNPQRSNNFLYDENILAFYFSATKEWEKWGINLGMRTEYTDYKGESVTTSQLISQNRWDIFPSLFIQYQVAPSDVINFSYGRRITRPSFQVLNPFQDVEDPYFINQGNPALVPYFSNSYEVTYSLRYKYNFTAAYKKTTDIINNVYLINDDLETISTYDNINDEDDYLVSFNTQFNLAKWWVINLYANTRYRKISVNNETKSTYEKVTPYFWINNRFTFKENFSLEVSGNYLGNAFYSIYDLKPQGVVSLSFRKSFFKDKLTANLNINDPFNFKIIRIRVDETDFDRSVKNILPNRSLFLGLSYSFSGGKENTNREYIESPNQDEINRIQKQ